MSRHDTKKVHAIFTAHHPKPWRCYGCNKTVKKLWVHHIDGNHRNNDPANLAAVHNTCHTRLHMKGKERSQEHADKISRANWQGTGTHCKHGHAMTPDNTVKDYRNGRKRCRTCRNYQSRRKK